MRSFLLLAVVGLVALQCVSAASFDYTPAALADQIHNLPGLSTQPTFNMFSGYLAVPQTTKQIFYWYVESTHNPGTDPLVWWSNGGPGCSGLLGFLTEHGPFRVSSTTTGTLEDYPFAWNKLANVLYVEAPVGVGFSFSDNPSDYTTGDAQTAADNFGAILSFFAKFPHLVNNDFYISAESYGGHYVPTLAQYIIESDAGIAGFKGFLLGNPLTDMDENMNWGQAATLCGHSLASSPTCEAFNQHCLLTRDAGCTAAQSAVVAEAGGLDAYGLDYPTCSDTKTVEQKRLLSHLYAKKMHEKGFNTTFKHQLMKNAAPEIYDPCTMGEETTYLAREDVRTALHVSPKAAVWAACSTQVNYNQSDVNTPMEPIYTFLLQNAPSTGFRMVIFSGDDDSVCASLGTQHWMNNMGWTITSPWSQWTYQSAEYGPQIGGSVVQYSGISFVTVHSAGHMVSGYQPERGFNVLQLFLDGTFSTAAGPGGGPGKATQQKPRKVISEQ